MRSLHLSLFLCVALAGLTAFGIPARAQTTNATVTGQITDPQGRAVPGVAVVFTNLNTGILFATKTNGDGIYTLPTLQPGIYRANITKDGFKSVVKSDIQLQVQANVSLNFALQLGSVTETVTVRGGAPLVNTTSGSVSTVVGRNFVKNMPLNGRSFQNLIALSPGVVVATSSFYDQGQFDVNGQRGDANYYTIDGVSANVNASAGPQGQSAGGALPALTALGGMNNLVSVDDMQEFRIQTSSYAPEFGRQPGAQIAITSRSGTNQFHGDAYDYFRNDVLDANDWFADQQGLPKPEERQNDFGGVLGGPIWKKHTFFFFSYEGLRLRQPQVAITSVPSMAARQAAVATTQPLLNAFPIPNGPDLGNGLAQLSASYSDPSTLDATSIRIDQSIGKRLSVFGRFDHAPSETLQRGQASALSRLFGARFPTDTLTLGATYLLNPTMSDDLRVNYSRTNGVGTFSLDSFGGAVPPPESLLFPSFASPSDSAVFVDILPFSNGTNLSTGLNTSNLQRQVNVVNNFSLLKGSHNLKFGVDYRWVSPVLGVRKADYQYLFGNVAQAESGTAAVVYVVNRAGMHGFTYLLNQTSSYAQDTWSAKPRLTLTYGLRWDVNTAPSISNAPPPLAVTETNDLATMALAPSGTPLWHTTYGNLAPRIGIAYQLVQSSRWSNVLRGGFGIFYDLGYGQLGDVPVTDIVYFGERILSNTPFPLSSSQAQPPALQTPPPVSEATVYDPHLKLPYTYEWNATFEQTLGQSQALSIAYVGAVGRRLLQQRYFEHPNSTFVGLLDLNRNASTSDYHALQVEFQRRMSSGLEALGSYTFSHCLDDSSTDAFELDPGRGSCAFDIRHMFSGAVTYDIPGPHGNPFARAILKNWSVDTIGMARTATPVDIGAAYFALAAGVFANPRPNVVSGVPLYLYGSQYPGGKAINPAAFTAPAAGTQGDLGRNALRGFGAWQLDLALARQFNFTERWRLQFRSEFFNVFNHPNFANPENILTSPFFGRSLSMLGRSLGQGGVNGGFNPLYQIGGPRSIQLALKLLF